MRKFELVIVLSILALIVSVAFSAARKIYPTGEAKAIEEAMHEQEWYEVKGKSVFSNAFKTQFCLEFKVPFTFEGENMETEFSRTVTEDMFNQAKVGDMFNVNTYELKPAGE